MRLLIITRYYSETAFGGVERFIRSLSRFMVERGDQVMILCLTADVSIGTCDNASVRTVAAPANRYLPLEKDALDRIKGLISDFAPPVAHFITFGRAEATVARHLVAVGVPYGYLYNSPSCSCRRSDLLRWGKVVCDGKIDATRCVACKLNQHRLVPRALALPLTSIANKLPPLPGIKAIQQLSREIAEYAAEFRHFLQSASVYLLHAKWPAEVLMLNRAVDGRFLFFEQGIAASKGSCRWPGQECSGANFRIGYIGRREYNKGIHLALAAFCSIQDSNAQFIIAGASLEETTYEKRLKRMAAGDTRVVFLPPLSGDELAEFLKSLSLLVIPSIWLETGPLVLREAIASGLPVLASSTMGDPSLLQHGGLPPVKESTKEEWHRRLLECIVMHHAGRWQMPEPASLKTEEEMNCELVNFYENLANSGAHNGQTFDGHLHADKLMV